MGVTKQAPQPTKKAVESVTEMVIKYNTMSAEERTELMA